jgi:DNA-binding NarL/FixJ family response regulator
MNYRYRGNHHGPDLFDAATPEGDRLPSPYDKQVTEDRKATIAYFYIRGYHDEEIATQLGVDAGTVLNWRRKRGLKSNWDLVGA